MSVEINRVTNANVYINGDSLLGRAEEIALPEIKHKLVDHKALGMTGTTQFFAGIDKMVARIKWNSFYPEVLKASANPRETVQLQIRASVESYNSKGIGDETPIVMHIHGQFATYPLGYFKQNDNVELAQNISVNYMKLVYGKEDVMEFDALSNIYKVNGEDILATYKSNLGI